MFLMNVFLAFLCAVFKVREVPSGLSFRTAAGIPQNDIAEEKGITRSQACMQLATEDYPDALYVVGNAPTALFEICDLVRKGKMHPAGIIGAPVGFVHVCESKHAAKTLTGIPKIIIEGRKGGSNLAATLVNAILTYDDAAQLRPGRDL